MTLLVVVLEFLSQGGAIIGPWRLLLLPFSNCISFRLTHLTLDFLLNKSHHLLQLMHFSPLPLQTWSSPGSLTSTRPLWSRTRAASSRRRRETCTSPKSSPQMLATTPAWWPTLSPRAVCRARPPLWSCAATVRRAVQPQLVLYWTKKKIQFQKDVE